ncbi:MAG: hypothetical protein Q7S92_02010 [Candidatus Diapherotrites archaeon]|nr:hypothetical protein [Candidatus Diapherotrites archaeon]
MKPNKVLFIIMLIILIGSAYAQTTANEIDQIEPLEFRLECLQNVSLPGNTVSAQIYLENKSETVLLKGQILFSVVNPKTDRIQRESIPFELKSKEKQTIEKKIVLEKDAELGTYQINAVLSLPNADLPASCNLYVEDGINYYYKTLDELSSQTLRIEKLIQEVRTVRGEIQGLNLMESGLVEIQKQLRELRRQVISRNYGGFTELSNQIYIRLSALESETTSALSESSVGNATISEKGNFWGNGIWIGLIALALTLLVVFKFTGFGKPPSQAFKKHNTFVFKEKNPKIYRQTTESQETKSNSQETTKALEKAYKLGAIKRETFEKATKEIEK